MNKQQVSLKYLNALFKLLEKLKNIQKTIYQVLESYKCSEKGYIDLNDFDRIMKLIDKTFTD